MQKKQQQKQTMMAAVAEGNIKVRMNDKQARTQAIVRHESWQGPLDTDLALFSLFLDLLMRSQTLAASGDTAKLTLSELARIQRTVKASMKKKGAAEEKVIVVIGIMGS